MHTDKAVPFFSKIPPVGLPIQPLVRQLVAVQKAGAGAGCLFVGAIATVHIFRQSPGGELGIAGVVLVEERIRAFEVGRSGEKAANLSPAGVA